MDNHKMLRGPMRNRRFYRRLMALQVGGCLTLTKAEWKAQSSPVDTLRYGKTYRGQFLVRLLDDKTGWVIWRLKKED